MRVLEIVHKKIGRKIPYPKWADSACIVDAQSVKNTSVSKQKGYDAGKKISGIKRHIAVDTNGLIHALEVTTADIPDRTGAVQMIERNTSNLSTLDNLMVDGGYSGNPFSNKVQQRIHSSVEVVKRSQLHTFAVFPKR